MNTETTRSPGGITNAAPWQTMGDAGMPDLTWSYFVFDDFLAYSAGYPWALTGVGVPTAAMTSGEGGLLLLSTTAAANDTAIIGRAVNSFKLSSVPGNAKATFYKIQFIADSATLSAITAGLVSGTPLTPTDGAWIGKAAGVNTFTLNHITGGVTTSTPLPAACTLTAGVPVELGMEVNPDGSIAVYWNPTTGNNDVPPNSPRGYVASIKPPVLSSALLQPFVAMLASTAVARTMQLDYIFASKDR